TDFVPTVLLVGMIALLISASFIQNKPDITNGLICVSLMVIGMIYTYCKTHDTAAVTAPLKAIDFETIGLLFGLFLVIGGITHMGVVDAAAGLLAQMGGGNVFAIYTAIVWASVLFSAFIEDRKSTRLNSSHVSISYAVFCLKKKNSTYLALI